MDVWVEFVSTLFSDTKGGGQGAQTRQDGVLAVRWGEGVGVAANRQLPTVN